MSSLLRTCTSAGLFLFHSATRPSSLTSSRCTAEACTCKLMPKLVPGTLFSDTVNSEGAHSVGTSRAVVGGWASRRPSSPAARAAVGGGPA
eukprot:CAMPEP_0115194276 /NCGR_PEP_ID=MMETSP0270-20121206/13989_1 /TAXON_ID=71861 /ORGANISM="Scrippsiella trochoidea, Strain CCMP3099" /LENGTH=90 /DNA_ID=CAMNT_0002607577 /DNA_START=55 /DNA_END=324 /DNA_ORIENTATION=+